MAATGHCRPALVAFVSLVAFAAIGCDAGVEPPGAPLAAGRAGASTPEFYGGKLCGQNVGIHEQWQAQAPLPEARTRHAALLLPDGRVLVAGGGGEWPYPTTVELFDPAKNTWTASGTLPEPLPAVGAALLKDGRVLLSPGGLVHDPMTGTSEPVPLTPSEESFEYAFQQSALTPLPSGLVLRTGGSDGDTILDEAVLYDPTTNSWKSAGEMSVTRHLHTSTLLADGRVLVVGGYTLDGNEKPQGRKEVEIYDPSANTWTAAAPTTVPRMQHTATLLPSGRVLVIGGGGRIYSSEDEDAELLVEGMDTAEIYDPATDTWTPTAPPNLQHSPSQSAARLLQGSRVMAIDRDGAEIYDEDKDSWTVIDEPMSRAWNTATTLKDGTVLITGGDDGTVFANPPALTSVERYGKACTKGFAGRLVAVGAL